MFPLKRSRHFILLAGLVALIPAFGQRGSTGPAPSGGATPSSGGAPTSGGIGRPQSQPPGSTQGQTQPVFLSGRVSLEDGTPPPQPVPIQLVCNGSPYTEGYTNSRGDFSITLGASPTTALQDASSSGLSDASGGVSAITKVAGSIGSVNDQQWRTCEIRAQLAGYQSQTINLMNRRAMDNPNVGTILLHRLGQSEGTMISATELAAPKTARKAYEKGLDLIKKKKVADAQASFTKAVEEYPRYASAWAQLGAIAADKGDADAARHAFEQSINADPKYVVPYVEMSQLEVRARHWREGADTSEKAMRLDPFNYPQVYFFNAVAHYNLREIDAAEQSARRAQQLDTRHQIPQVSHLIGTILAERHDYKGAAAEMRDYLKLAPEAQDAAQARLQLERFEKLAPGAPAQPAQ